MNLKKLMLLPSICCVSIQQADAKVIYSPNKTGTFLKKIKENKHATINDIAPEAFASLLPGTNAWYRTAYNIPEYVHNKRKNNDHSEMPGIAAFVPTRNNSDINKAKVYVGWKYHYEQTKSTTPPNNTPNKTYGIAPLFRYSDYSHTERQLAICALTNANNKENEIITVTNSYNFLYPNNTLNLGNIRNINNVFEPETAKKITRKEVKKIIKATAKKIVGKMVNTEGILYIYTPVPMCTYSTNLADNGGILCVDYYAYLLQYCPKIKLHLYCDSKYIETLSSHVLDNVSVDEILNEMHQLLQKLPTQKYRINFPIIKYIKDGILAQKKGKWKFNIARWLTSYDEKQISQYKKNPQNIKNDILSAIKQYIKEFPSMESRRWSRYKDFKAFRNEILNTLIRLSLKKRLPDANKNNTVDRLTMHLIDPLYKIK